ncbi:hypothetical protein [Massilia sp. CF038]|uniref:hypothetical protein n=1 Tax=Massilia sp. CF038 TaxID=1881045 RepID=UPI000921A8D9|nr:hypothetical protein [Massilia sp. CF038]SHH65578.1 hypothetical protein SAMN05428948_4776 [Massilia sp. CF038]
MRYAAGELVKMGDKVQLGSDKEGEVVCIIDTNEYSERYSRVNWSYLNKGVLINFPQHGLLHYDLLGADVHLVARGGS